MTRDVSVAPTSLFGNHQTLPFLEVCFTSFGYRHLVSLAIAGAAFQVPLAYTSENRRLYRL